MFFLKKFRGLLFEGVVACIVFLFYGFLRLIGLKNSRSFLGGVIAFLGPRISKNKRSLRNLKKIFPQWPEGRVHQIARDVWKNLGYVVAEYAHLEKIDPLKDPQIQVEGIEHLLALKEDGKPGLIFTGHYGNWELVSLLCKAYGVRTAQVYRFANNRPVNWLIRRLQTVGADWLISRGKDGGRSSVLALQEGYHLILLIDQKMNTGIEVPFMGFPAMTASGIARLAERFACPVLPMHVVREAADKFRIVCEAPFTFSEGKDPERYLQFMKKVHGHLERWIRERPDLWLWLHNRW